MSDELGAREAEVYDRQIRLWGIEAQKRIQNTRVLIGGFRALNAEVAKNLILSGITATIQDHENVSAVDVGGQFFLEAKDIGKNRAAASLARVQELNPLVTVDCETEPLESKDEEYFKGFSVVIVSDCPLSLQIKIDKICRANKISFYAADTFGFNGIVFADLGQEFTYRMAAKADKPASDPITTSFKSLEEAVSIQWSTLKDRFGPVSRIYVASQLLHAFAAENGPFANVQTEENIAKFVAFKTKKLVEQGMPADYMDDAFAGHTAACARAELAPVCAILGGMIGQEVVKAVSGTDEPINNFFFWDGQLGSGVQKCIPAAAKKPPPAAMMDLDCDEVLSD
jgi:ubiquitin-like 1-activating enzyme E1 A